MSLREGCITYLKIPGQPLQKTSEARCSVAYLTRTVPALHRACHSEGLVEPTRCAQNELPCVIFSRQIATSVMNYAEVVQTTIIMRSLGRPSQVFLFKIARVPQPGPSIHFIVFLKDETRPRRVILPGDKHSRMVRKGPIVVAILYWRTWDK